MLLKKPLFISIFFVLFGICFIIGSIYNYQHTTYLINNGEITEATITSIINDRSGEDVQTKVFVEYVINGIRYTNELGTYISGMKEGQIVPIRYLPENPNIILYSKYEYVLFWIFLCIGSFSIIIGLIVFYFNFFKHKDFKENIIESNHF
jgi:hypothetical protein